MSAAINFNHAVLLRNHILIGYDFLKANGLLTLQGIGGIVGKIHSTKDAIDISNISQ